MNTTEVDSTKKSEAARSLAEKHFDVEIGMIKIFRLRARPETEASLAEPIKLLEVNAATVASGILPLSFAAMPARGLPFPMVIVEVTPEEFEMIERNELKLPHGWTIGEEIPRPAGSDGEK